MDIQVNTAKNQTPKHW